MAPAGSEAVFAHGVASGDPHLGGVVLWTRVTPTAPRVVPVRWYVATSPTMEDVVAHGEAEAAPERDFTVKVDVGGLAPGSTYYYAFDAGGSRSPVGRTRTAPVGAAERLRLGLVSCASWAHGYFNAYRLLAERDVDLVVHAGDYVYEDSGPAQTPGRSHDPPWRLRTLSDYRARHAQYRTDPDLQRLHRMHPMVAVWDDHDIAENAWRDGAAGHDPADDGDWRRRREAAVQAYLEWLPVRSPDPARPDRVYRTVPLGDLAQLIMLDTRLIGRDRPARAGRRAVATIGNRQRSLLGDEQRAWLQGQLRASTSRWRLLGNQVMMAPLRVVDVWRPLRRVVPALVAGGAGVNAGQWDGYPGEREALFGFLDREGIGNVVVLSGDLHSSWAAELTLDAKGDARPAGVEFVTGSVTAPSFRRQVVPAIPGAYGVLRRLVGRQNRHVRYFALEGHGYVVVDVTDERVRADWWHVETVAERAPGERLAASWVVRHGEPRLLPATAAAP